MPLSNLIILEDEDSQLWAVTIDDNGQLHSIQTSTGVVTTVIVNNTGGTVSYQLAIVYSGGQPELQFQPITLGSYNEFYSLITEDYTEVWNIGIDNNGNLTTALSVTTYSISGNTGAASAIVFYRGSATGYVTADGSGNFSITGLLNGNYIITPALEGYVFVPTVQNVTINNADVLGVNFIGEGIFSKALILETGMSNLVFPSDIGQGISGANEFGFKLPFKKTPLWHTLTQLPISNRGEVRISTTTYPVWMYEMDLAWMRGDFSPSYVSSAFQEILGFYGKVGGMSLDWLFSDDNDNTVTNAVIGYGDGESSEFQLVRQVGGLNDIIQNVNGNPIVYVNGVQQQQLGVFVGSASYPFMFGQENLLLQSEEFGTTPWVASGSGGGSAPTITNNAIVAPDGSTTASEIAFPTVSSSEFSQVLQTVTGSYSFVNQTVTFSVWLRVTSGSETIWLEVGDIDTHSVENLVTVTSTWTRYSVQLTFDQFVNSGSVVALIYSTNLSSRTIYAWGGQVERNQNGPGGYLATTLFASIPNGVIQFTDSVPPQVFGGYKITWSGNFYYRCRFLEDSWSDLAAFVPQIWEVPSLKFKSVIL